MKTVFYLAVAFVVLCMVPGCFDLQTEIVGRGDAAVVFQPESGRYYMFLTERSRALKKDEFLEVRPTAVPGEYEVCGIGEDEWMAVRTMELGNGKGLVQARALDGRLSLYVGYMAEEGVIAFMPYGTNGDELEKIVAGHPGVGSDNDRYVPTIDGERDALLAFFRAVDTSRKGRDAFVLLVHESRLQEQDAEFYAYPTEFVEKYLSWR